MQRYISPQKLLRLARELLGQGRGQPRNANLRRAVSTAYYALFHRVALDTVSHALPGAEPGEVEQAARDVSHTSIKQVASWIAGDMPPKNVVAVVKRLRLNADLTSVANAFVSLYERREQADYDHLADFTRPDARASVEEAARAVALIESLRSEDDFRSFLGLIVLRTTIGR